MEELAIQQSPQQKAEMWNAHLIRTRDRIAQFRAKLQAKEGLTGEEAMMLGERTLIEGEIAKLEDQLVPPSEMPQADTSPSIIQQLKGEIQSLAAIVKELMGKSAQAKPDAG